MNPPFKAALAGLNPRLLKLVLPPLLLLVALECWLLVLRAPLQQWRALHSEAATLEAQTQPISLADVTAKQAELAQLAEQIGLPGAHPEGRDDGYMALINLLDRTAQHHAVTLGGVKPAVLTALGPVQRRDYEVRARGPYAALVAWLGEVSASVAPITLNDLALQAQDGHGVVELSLHLSDFRPAVAASGATP
jgi:Tfp pilus assembly protein PilO